EKTRHGKKSLYRPDENLREIGGAGHSDFQMGRKNQEFLSSHGPVQKGSSRKSKKVSGNGCAPANRGDAKREK
ncbi:MAG: hypothetical protein IKO93_14585, partial [Lentisphaeria bacterium]|nr:hypothetical protein [Lentisphaeria bacterium]